jgi:uncharacterized protein YdhG (YjbR/CyaY superfamily)
VAGSRYISLVEFRAVASRKAAPRKTVDEYLAAVPPEYRAALERLRRIIKSAAPDAEEFIGYGMPAYRQGGMRVYFAAFQDHCSFFGGSAKVRRQFSEELKPFRMEKGTLRFTPDRPLPARLVRRIVIGSLEESAARRPQ